MAVRHYRGSRTVILGVSPTRALSQLWDEIPILVDYEPLNSFAIVVDCITVAERSADSRAGVLVCVGLSIEVNTFDGAESPKGMAKKIQAA